MAGEENLIPMNERTEEEARELSRKGGIASGEARREKANLRKCLEELLNGEVETKKGEKVTGAFAISAKQFERALKGDSRAFELIRDTIGQKPVEKVMTSDIDPDVLKEIDAVIDKMGE